MDESGRSASRAQLNPRWFLHLAAVKDTRAAQTRSALELREHTAAMTAVKGKRWYAKKLLELNQFMDSKAASRALIQRSRKQITQSRQRIVLTKNILAFSRRSRWQVN